MCVHSFILSSSPSPLLSSLLLSLLSFAKLSSLICLCVMCVCCVADLDVGEGAGAGAELRVLLGGAGLSVLRGVEVEPPLPQGQQPHVPLHHDRRHPHRSWLRLRPVPGTSIVSSLSSN